MSNLHERFLQILNDKYILTSKKITEVIQKELLKDEPLIKIVINTYKQHSIIYDIRLVHEQTTVYLCSIEISYDYNRNVDHINFKCLVEDSYSEQYNIKYDITNYESFLKRIHYLFKCDFVR